MMIATGGLLRINARRQDSLRSKNRAENKRKRKAKKKRKNEVVVVKGKLKLCSVSGLVAAVGVFVLLVGVAMAILGYWPPDSLLFPGATQSGAEGNHTSSRSTASSYLERTEGEAERNSTEPVRRNTQSFVEEFLDRYLYSDRLKVLGPLIMGIGIFLFICANAVLHENRDKKTKVINLRDIYSTVIDLHRLRKDSSAPGNGFVNYVQSKGVEGKPSAAYAAALLAKGSWGHDQDETGGSGCQGSLSRQSSCCSRSGALEAATVYTIYQENRHYPPVDNPSMSPRCHTLPCDPPSLCSHTLPSNPPSPCSHTLPRISPSPRIPPSPCNSPSPCISPCLSEHSPSPPAPLLAASSPHPPQQRQPWVEAGSSWRGGWGSSRDVLCDFEDRATPLQYTVDRSRRLSYPLGYTKMGALAGKFLDFGHTSPPQPWPQPKVRGQTDSEEGQEEEVTSRRVSNKERLLIMAQTDSVLEPEEEGEEEAEG